MDPLPKVLKVAGILCVVLLLGLAVGWFGTRGAAPKHPTPAPAPVQPVESSPAHAAPPPPVNILEAAMSNTIPQIAPTDAPPEIVASTNWENRVDKILGSTASDGDKARQLLALFPTLPEEGKVEAAQHLTNLTPDQDFQSLRPFMTNSALPEAVMDVLLAGLLNRPNSLKLPMLLDMAQTEGHPKATEAKDMLTLFLQEDNGKDWGKWESRIQQWVKDNPD